VVQVLAVRAGEPAALGADLQPAQRRWRLSGVGSRGAAKGRCAQPAVRGQRVDQLEEERRRGAVAPGAVFADDLASIKAAGTIDIGIFQDFPPFASVGTDLKLKGYDIDMAEAIGKDLGVKVNLVPITGQTRIAALEADKVDVLLSLGFSEERAKALTFAAAYAPYYVASFAGKDQKIASPADLSGKTVAVNRGTLDDSQITAAAPADATIQRFDSYAGVISAFLAGKVDAVFVGNDVGAEVITKKADAEQKFVLLSSPSRIGVRLGEKGLADEITKLVQTMKTDGRLDTMSKTWLGKPMAPEDLVDSNG
jgi:polar amino acid transport system substrate-binding protein